MNPFTRVLNFGRQGWKARSGRDLSSSNFTFLASSSNASRTPFTLSLKTTYIKFLHLARSSKFWFPLQLQTTAFNKAPFTSNETPPPKMSVVSLLGVNVLNNPAKFGDSYEFEITFECLEPLQKGRLHCMYMTRSNTNIPSQISNGS